MIHGLLALLFAATIWDLTYCRVPNHLCVFGMGLGMLWNCLEGGGNGLWTSVLGMLIPLLFLWIPMCISALGAGDVKVMMMVGSFLGKEAMPGVILLSFAAAAVMAVIKLTKHHQWRLRLNYLADYVRRSALHSPTAGISCSLPYVDLKRIRGTEPWTIRFCAAIQAGVIMSLWMHSF